MTGRKVERERRTAYRSASVRSTGVSPLMPPHSQGAERRREHHTGRAGPRWRLRVLVLGGLAGVAWLLSGAAAHAADRDPAPGSSLIGAAAHGDDHDIPVVDRVLRAAVESLASDARKLVPITDLHEPDQLQKPEPPQVATAPEPRVTAAGRHPAAVRAPESQTVSDTPRGDGPAPPRGHLGAANGVPAAGPSTGLEGCPAALLPTRVADSRVARHRLPIATGVEVRCHDAEAPTVSPD